MSWDYTAEIGGKTKEGTADVSSAALFAMDDYYVDEYGSNPYAHVYRVDRDTNEIVHIVNPIASGAPWYDPSAWTSSIATSPSVGEPTSTPGAGAPSVITSTGTRQASSGAMYATKPSAEPNWIKPVIFVGLVGSLIWWGTR